MTINGLTYKIEKMVLADQMELTEGIIEDTAPWIV